MSQYFHHNSVRVVSNSLFGTASEALYARLKKIKRKDVECQKFFRKVLKSSFFQVLMISAITTNAAFMVLKTDYNIHYRMFQIFEISEILFVSIYTCEFLMKVYVDPIKYWSDGYNLLDVVIIFIILIPYTLRKIKGRLYKNLNIADGIQSLRILKLISYSRGIRVDGWTNLQEQLDQRKFTISRAFTILFILLASFIFLNMFVGVMIMHTEDSIKKFQRELMVERHVTLLEEKQVILRRQQEEVNRLITTKKTGGKTFTELVEEFKKTLRHTDPMVLDDFGTSLPFVNVYLSTLDNQDNTLNKLQELYYEIVNVLCLMLEDLPQKKSSHSSELLI
ncbi:cation channel sperm-associated protein 3 isoform X2 [Microtus ochrogaster]|uniref:Cation channel sperm-associated protein 3 isoform X2 n=1 Tax=Microtus ochrogaster TaxID=79684 RepID=A0ABM1UA68_MICOH|nr:cation channel sperm-associated protein 3 isoform X2 [Microtus ochrogaster]